MKFFLREIVALCSRDFFLQIQKFQITKIIFQIVRRITDDEFIEILDRCEVCDPIVFEKHSGIDQRPPVVMDSDVGKCIEPKKNRSILLVQAGFRFGNRCHVVGHHFCVGCPAFYIAAKIEETADRIGVL